MQRLSARADAMRSAVRHRGKRMRDAVIRKLVLWSVFGVLMGFAPLIIRAIVGNLTTDPVTTNDVILSGEVLLVTATLAASAVGDLVASLAKATLPPMPAWSIALAGLTLLAIVVASAIYGFVLSKPSTLNLQMLTNWTARLSASLLLSGAACEAVAEVRS
jgi:hypothetical protein